MLSKLKGGFRKLRSKKANNNSRHRAGNNNSRAGNNNSRAGNNNSRGRRNNSRANALRRKKSRKNKTKGSEFRRKITGRRVGRRRGLRGGSSHPVADILSAINNILD
jgi:hypothetical protein